MSTLISTADASPLVKIIYEAVVSCEHRALVKKLKHIATSHSRAFDDTSRTFLFESIPTEYHGSRIEKDIHAIVQPQEEK